MLITIHSVATESNPKGYRIANVSYEREGKSETRKVMSFANKEVYAALENLKSFPVAADVALEKDAKGYWQWKGLSFKEVGAAAKPANSATRSGFETAEERARRQVYIIRQSSVANAIEFIKAKEPKGTVMDIADVIALAQKLENYVLDVSLPSNEEIQ